MSDITTSALSETDTLSVGGERRRRTGGRGAERSRTGAAGKYRNLVNRLTKTELLDPAALDEMHEASLTILEEIGMDIMLPEARAPSGRRPRTASAVSDLPDPDSPMRPRRLPSGTSKDTPSTTRRPSISTTRSRTSRPSAGAWRVMRPPPGCGSRRRGAAASGRSPLAARLRAD